MTRPEPFDLAEWLTPTRFALIVAVCGFLGLVAAGVPA